MASYGEEINQIAKYADLLTGFAIAQTMAYVYALGKEEKFRERVQEWRNLVMFFIKVSGVLYQIFIIFLAMVEALLRYQAQQSGLVIVAMLFIAIGRMLITGGCTILSVYATKLTGTKDEQ